MSFDIKLTKRLGECMLDVEINSGDSLIAVSGQSGAGKTTLLNCIAGLATPDNGRIRIGSQTVFDSQTGIDVPAQMRGCGYVFQDNRLFPHKSVRANLIYGQRRASNGSAIITLEEVTALLDIGHLLDRRPARLSGGEIKRVAIGRALLSSPSILLLDEPLTSLDAGRGEQILCTIERIRDELGLPIIYVSHIVDEVARLATTVVTLD